MALVSFDLKLCLLLLGWGELSGEERAGGIYFRSFDIKYILMVWKRFNTTLNYHNEQISIPIICHMILLWINLYIKKKILFVWMGDTWWSIQMCTCGGWRTAWESCPLLSWGSWDLNSATQARWQLLLHKWATSLAQKLFILGKEFTFNTPWNYLSFSVK